MAITKDLPRSYPGTRDSKVAKLVPVEGFPGMLTDDKNPVNPKKWGLDKKNYKKTLSTDQNIAIVFDKLPNKYNNRIVIDGDKTDLRLADNDGKKVIVGLKFKGSKKALQDGINEGFVIQS